MTRDDIIRMAQEAGFSAYHLAVLDQGIYRFAHLVAAAEREAFDAKYPIQLTHDQYNVVINAALKDEREMCAKVCEAEGERIDASWVSCAAAIRARGAGMKCKVKDCENHTDQGVFVGFLCMPCYTFLNTGEGTYSQLYRNTVAVEREACAKVAEEWQLRIDDPKYQTDCATAIRERGAP